MRRDIALAGFVMTEEEWDSMDARGRVQLLAAITRRDGWIPAAPVAFEERDVEPYALYELVWSRA